jgi:hypothetical protein
VTFESISRNVVNVSHDDEERRVTRSIGCVCYVLSNGLNARPSRLAIGRLTLEREQHQRRDENATDAQFVHRLGAAHVSRYLCQTIGI